MDSSALKRLKFLLVIGLGAWVIIWGRLFYVQVFSHQRALEILADQHKYLLELSGKRGNIYDRNLIPLACGVNSLSLYAVPDSVRNRRYLSRVLAEVVGTNPDSLLASLSSGKRFVWIKRKVNPDQLVEFKKWDLKGAYLVAEERRHYPEGKLGRSFLGYTDIDNVGIAGLEKNYDSLLRPKTVEVPFLRDARGGLRPLNYKAEDGITDGMNLILTIDIRLQEIVETELRRAVGSCGALSGIAIFMDPFSGEILAFANSINGQEGSAYNKGIVDCFEPGSTFKLLTFASALEHGVFKPEAVIHGEWGECQFPGIVVHDHEPFGPLTFRRAFEVSSNVISAKIAREVGWDKFCETLQSFGIGEKTGVDLPGETRGVIPRFDQSNEVTLATMAFGQGIAVTALRLLCCYAVVANGGFAVSPSIVKKTLNSEGQVLPARGGNQPQQVCGKRVLSPTTVSTLVEFMEGVVDSGTALQARMYNLKVAGKTGTAEKPLEGERGYKPGAYVASFVGFLPSDKPRFLGLVILDEPQGQHYGGQVAAPVFRRIVEKALVLPGYEIERNGKGSSIESLTERRSKPSPVFLSDEKSYALEVGQTLDFENP
jgi:cell division protein FtsI (penicillin-binding protein 3)